MATLAAGACDRGLVRGLPTTSLESDCPVPSIRTSAVALVARARLRPVLPHVADSAF